MLDVSQDHLDLARKMMTPRRRAPRGSAIAWDRSDSVPTAAGPVTTWSKGDGPVVLLVHGWDADHTDLDAFVEPFVAAGRRAVSFDVNAHGESPGTTASLFDFASALEGVAAHVGGADAIVAHSAGCAGAAIALARGLGLRAAAFVAPPLRYEDFVRATAERKGVEPDALVAAFERLGLEIRSLDIRKNAVLADVPLLIVHSRDDRICDVANAAKIGDVWKRSVVEYVEELGHSRILRDRATIARVVDFLTK
jgi:pimeloyl-ACP methyl ester carboxylesterase